MPTQAQLMGVAASSTNNTVTLPNTFPQTNGALVGFPLVKINGSNVKEANYITGYTVSGGIPTATVASNWNVNPVGSTDKIVVGCIKSIYQPLAGTGIGGGNTEAKISGDLGGGGGGGIPVYCSGGTLVSFEGTPYLACGAPGTQQTAAICCNSFGLYAGGQISLSGKVNAENYGGGNSSLVWSTKTVGVDFELGRLAGTFTQLFRCTAADATLGDGQYAGFVSVRAEGGGVIGAQPLFNVAQYDPINYVEIEDNSASTIGTIAAPGVGNAVPITKGHFAGPISASTLAANVSGGSGYYYGSAIIPYQSVVGVGPNGTAISANPLAVNPLYLEPTITQQTTTGGSSQQRQNIAIPGNAVIVQGGYVVSTLECDIDVINAESSTVAIVFYAQQGAGAKQSLFSFTLAASLSAKCKFKIDGSGRVSYIVTQNGQYPVQGVGSFTLTPGSAWNIEIWENNATGNASSLGMSSFLRACTIT
jgi:hypothetical protein